MSQERRHSVRASMRLLTFLKLLDTGKVKRVLTRNISGLGLCVVAEDILAPGTKLAVELQLPDRREPVTFTAFVVWNRLVGGTAQSSHAVETGLQFDEIDPKAQTLLQQYARLNALPPEP